MLSIVKIPSPNIPHIESSAALKLNSTEIAGSTVAGLFALGHAAIHTPGELS